MLVNCIRKGPSRNFGRETSCPYTSVVFLSPCGGYRDATPNYARNDFFLSLFILLLINFIIIRGHIVTAVDPSSRAV